jgi:hypothetical protein
MLLNANACAAGNMFALQAVLCLNQTLDFYRSYTKGVNRFLCCTTAQKAHTWPPHHCETGFSPVFPMMDARLHGV